MCNPPAQSLLLWLWRWRLRGFPVPGGCPPWGGGWPYSGDPPYQASQGPEPQAPLWSPISSVLTASSSTKLCSGTVNLNTWNSKANAFLFFRLRQEIYIYIHPPKLPTLSNQNKNHSSFHRIICDHYCDDLKVTGA